ncbi:hypothetical protein AVEN_163373-1 [Araneus ventricosus]|uniref:Uncharacterized protein n=1 Tax=Araneus ventricosus TaxID=182803 RepID=A0A4Y2KEF7_ARAVE|nr:hypothetical protein AVEN_163373-1 [Araneus ventricosus]
MPVRLAQIMTSASSISTYISSTPVLFPHPISSLNNTKPLPTRSHSQLARLDPFSVMAFKTGTFWEEATSTGLAQHGWSVTTPPPSITLPEGARKWAVVCKDNWTFPYRAYHLSDLRTSPPLKRSLPPQTGLLRY